MLTEDSPNAGDAASSRECSDVGGWRGGHVTVEVKLPPLDGAGWGEMGRAGTQRDRHPPFTDHIPCNRQQPLTISPTIF